ncbi:MAG: hypothetical protein AMXMBFR42_03730 [Burkholderiales bacterium]
MEQVAATCHRIARGAGVNRDVATALDAPHPMNPDPPLRGIDAKRVRLKPDPRGCRSGARCAATEDFAATANCQLSTDYGSPLSIRTVA